MDGRNQSFRRRRFGFIFAPIFLVALLVLSAVVMWLWNAILPDLVHVERISYRKAAGLLVLCRILFGGFRFGPPRGIPPFANRDFREKWMSMSEEERKQFKERLRQRCGPHK
ncbi:MAG: hypothetical protein BGP14_09765 [Sphingobacteriales bacterium 44-15]|nr:MAG: hypothetical protein BGP14_09765 [Sphingobacteriales bacterium 44-15]